MLTVYCQAHIAIANTLVKASFVFLMLEAQVKLFTTNVGQTIALCGPSALSKGDRCEFLSQCPPDELVKLPHLNQEVSAKAIAVKVQWPVTCVALVKPLLQSVGQQPSLSCVALVKPLLSHSSLRSYALLAAPCAEPMRM